MPVLLHKPTGRIFPFNKIMSERADMETLDEMPKAETKKSKEPKAPRQPKVNEAPVDVAAPEVVPAVPAAAPTADEVSFEE